MADEHAGRQEGGASHAGGPIGEEDLGSYRAVADGQETVPHRTLPLLPHFPQAVDDKHKSLERLFSYHQTVQR